MVLLEDDNLLNKHHTIWDKISTNIQNKLDGEPVYNNFFWKTQKKSYGDEATDFCNKEIPKVGFNQACLAVITIDSALNKDKNC